MIDHGALRARAEALAARSSMSLWVLAAECASIITRIAPNQRRAWLSEVVLDLYQRQAGLCALCGAAMELGDHEVDHIMPFCYGGGNERTNIQLAHPACNREKRASVDPRDLIRYLEDRYMNR
jgi:5-methylcytosine-specific restriction endonuclease McrA